VSVLHTAVVPTSTTYELILKSHLSVISVRNLKSGRVPARQIIDMGSDSVKL
jgi:hypothetical protein